MSTKMEQLLDLLVNEEMEKAHELFHEIVVEKSRDIYENLIAEEAQEDEEEMDESADEEDEEQDESIDEETTFEIGGDAADDMMGDVGGDDEMGGLGGADDMGGDDEFGGDELGSGGTDEERIEDLEDALAELKAEFEALMADEKNEPEHSDGEEDPDFGGEDDGEEADDEEGDEDEMMGMESTQVREYVEKVGNDWEKNSMKSPRPVGSGTGDKAGQATETGTKSVGLQNPKGRPTTTASAHNLLNGGTGVGEMSGTSPNADKGSRGLVGNTKGEFTDGVTTNKNGSTTGVKKLSKVTQGHGAEKKGQTAEFQGVGANTGGPAGQTGSGNTRSPADRRQ